MTRLAGGVDDPPDELSGDATAAPGRIDEEILNRADSALYLAKQQGRNRVVAG